jgi:hypothetical protein
MIESVSVFVVIQLKETGLCSGITIVYVMLCIEETKEKQKKKRKAHQNDQNRTARNIH